MCVLVSVIAVIAATLFPLWPAEMRVGVYYLSVAAGCFVASILLLAVGKTSALTHKLYPQDLYTILRLGFSVAAALKMSFAPSTPR